MSADRLTSEINKRRTFGIISHPDAGKTTMTEKLLHLGGAIQMAGTVKAKKSAAYATSDWMELEKQRGISVTTSVMRFSWEGYEVNLLDTPGHNDFSEDTYRTLSAVDSALMMIDSARGVETQTIKLMEVCRLRSTPIVTFINKLDREGLEPFELLDNLEEVLSLDAIPMTWPIGMGRRFRGVYDIQESRLQLYDSTKPGGQGESHQLSGLDDPQLDSILGKNQAGELREELELIIGAGEEFSLEQFHAGKQTPVFFGSALSGFGVPELLRSFLEITSPPLGRAADERFVEPTEEKFSGFVFKIQANMDPKHRDRIAFLRVVSGHFERHQRLHLVRLKREVRMSTPTFFMANEREIVEEAWPGDIVGLHDTGLIEIGDTFTEGEELHFRGVPSFAPEIFRKVRLDDPLKMKNLRKGLEQLAQEGAVQLFIPVATTDMIVGVVGQLQLDVLQHRLQGEYRVRSHFESIELATARWYQSDDEAAMSAFERSSSRAIARDVRGRPVFLAESAWRLRYTEEKNPKIRFLSTSEGVSARPVA